MKPFTPREGGLAALGHRFVRRGIEFTWTHPNCVKPTDIDCTDMEDERFEREVSEASWLACIYTDGN